MFPRPPWPSLWELPSDCQRNPVSRLLVGVDRREYGASLCCRNTLTHYFPYHLRAPESDTTGKARIPRPFLIAQLSHQTRFHMGSTQPGFFFSRSRAALKRRLVKLF